MGGRNGRSFDSWTGWTSQSFHRLTELLLTCRVQGGYMRLYKGHDINQIPDALKADVPEEIKQQARDMAR